MSPLKYMGSKRSLAPQIAALVAQHGRPTVVDAFAGTCAVGTAVAGNHRVFANDVHAFAEVIARTLLVVTARTPLPSEAWEELLPFYEKNFDRLQHAFAAHVSAEERLLSEVQIAGWKQFLQFSQVEVARPVPRRISALAPISEYRTGRKRVPYSLFSRFYAHAYFGLKQSIEIDSLRYAIDRADQSRRDIYLFALLNAVSHCAATPGHFAQFLVPRDEANTRYVARIRRRSIRSYFNEALLALNKPRCLDRRANRVFRSDATEFVRSLAARARGTRLVIYADPPYSRAQYSRYYHVLETLVLYDYPDATGKGRYRDDRFETDFSRKGKVIGALGNFVEAAAITGSPLFLSYPRNGLVYQAGGDVLSILKRHYRKATIAASIDLNHSTMGAAPGSASIKVMEDVYHAEP